MITSTNSRPTTFTRPFSTFWSTSLTQQPFSYYYLSLQFTTITSFDSTAPTTCTISTTALTLVRLSLKLLLLLLLVVLLVVIVWPCCRASKGPAQRITWAGPEWGHGRLEQLAGSDWNCDGVGSYAMQHMIRGLAEVTTLLLPYCYYHRTYYSYYYSNSCFRTVFYFYFTSSTLLLPLLIL
jgi:hypothetical protein